MIITNQESANPGKKIPFVKKRKNKTNKKTKINKKLNFERELMS